MLANRMMAAGIAQSDVRETLLSMSWDASPHYPSAKMS
jgi:hypothetical protein